MKRIILFNLVLCISALSVFIVTPIINAQQQEQQGLRSCQNTQENIRKDATLAKIADSVTGGKYRGEIVNFICVTDNTIILRFDYFFITRNNESNWGWSAIDMLINQANYTLDQIVPYQFMVNQSTQTAMRHHVAILTK